MANEANPHNVQYYEESLELHPQVSFFQSPLLEYAPYVIKN